MHRYAIAAAAAAVIVALGLSLSPALEVGFENLATHVAVDTGAATVATLLGYILVGRFRRRGRLGDLLLVGALLLTAISDLGFGAIPAAAQTPSRFAAWASSAAFLLAAAAFAAASLAGTRTIRRRRQPFALLVGVSLATAGLIALAAALLGPHLPHAVDPFLSPGGRSSRLAGSLPLRTLLLTGAVLYALAAAGFARRALAERDELVAWLSLVSVLAAGAGLNYFIFPSLFSRWVYLGDYLTVAAYLCLLLGAARELAAYQRGLATAAVLEERRRLARELHDGLAQELAFISTQSRRLLRGGRFQERNLEQLALAAERALDESRSAIAALSRRLDEPLEVAVAQAAEDVAERVGISVRFDLASGIEVPVATREALLRIVREAVSNTARHGHASHVTVALWDGDNVRLRIADDGVGFDVDAPRTGVGFGLVSMRERAQALGADLSVQSRPGEGTRIEVVIP